MEYLPTLGLFKITLGVNVGKYSIHGFSGKDIFKHGVMFMGTKSGSDVFYLLGK